MVEAERGGWRRHDAVVTGIVASLAGCGSWPYCTARRGAAPLDLLSIGRALRLASLGDRPT